MAINNKKRKINMKKDKIYNLYSTKVYCKYEIKLLE